MPRQDRGDLSPAQQSELQPLIKHEQAVAGFVVAGRTAWKRHGPISAQQLQEVKREAEAAGIKLSGKAPWERDDLAPEQQVEFLTHLRYRAIEGLKVAGSSTRIVYSKTLRLVDQRLQELADNANKSA